MRALAYLILALAKIIHLLINLYTFVVAIAVLLSWVSPDPHNPIIRLFRNLTEPIFYHTRRILPRFFFRTGFDFTPVLVLFILIIIDTVVVQLLYDFGLSLAK